jgi:hypothetical protein
LENDGVICMRGEHRRSGGLFSYIRRIAPDHPLRAIPVLVNESDGQESRLCYMGHVLMENRNGLAVAGDVTQATGTVDGAHHAHGADVPMAH